MCLPYSNNVVMTEFLMHSNANFKFRKLMLRHCGLSTCVMNVQKRYKVLITLHFFFLGILM